MIARTESVRKAYYGEAIGDSTTRPFQPELQIPLPARASHVAFSSDENVLVVAVGGDGGLVSYEVSSLLQGNTQPASTLALNGASLRSLLPNPVSPESFAVVTTDGELLMADLKTNQLIQGPSGPLLKSGVSSISWSNKGKQLVAGLADGTLFQMTPDGQGKAEIPRAPDIGSDQHGKWRSLNFGQCCH